MSLDYKLIKSRRRTFSLQIASDGGLVVRAPLQATTSEIAALIDRYMPWILKKSRAVREQTSADGVREGMSIWYQGQAYPLEFGDSGSSSIKFRDKFIVAEELSERAAELITTWLKRQALKILAHRTSELAAQFGLQYQRLRLNDARTNWGSCSGKGYLNFNWRLIQCPPEIIDYVIIHELAHLLEMNHSPRFWAEVARMCPEFEQRKNWLRRNAARFRQF